MSRIDDRPGEPAGAADQRPRRRVRAARRTGRATPYLFLAPYLTLFLVFGIVPIVFGAWISLHDWDYTLPGKPFVGLENYRDLARPDSPAFDPFWQSMKATGVFTAASVPLLLTAPLAVALVMNRRFRGRNLFRAVFFAPYVLGVAVVSLLWKYLLDGNIGLVNHYLDALGGPERIAWTTQLPAGWFALVGVTVWWTLGFNAVIYLAGLQDIPRELHEAAQLDGAGAWHRFRHVTLPGLRPVLFFVVMVTIIASANMFGQSYLITQGAPGKETRTAIYYLADIGLKNFQMGRAAAASYVLTFALMLLSLIVYAMFRRRGEGESA